MLSIKRLFSNLGGFVSNLTVGLKNNQQIKEERFPSDYDLESPGFEKFINKINDISKLHPKEQKIEREYFVENLLIDFSEAELIDIFSCINLHKGLSDETKKQATLSIVEILRGKTNIELHDYLTNEENSHIARKLAIFELVDRQDTSAVLALIYRVIVDNDDIEVRKTAALGLGEIGGNAALEVLEKVEKDDPIYKEAQKSIEKIKEKSEGKIE